MLDLAGKYVRSDVESSCEFAENSLDDLSINSAVKMLRNQLNVGRNNDHQKASVVFRVQFWALDKAIGFIQKFGEFGPPLLDRFESCFHKNMRYLFFRKFAFG